MAVTLRQRLGPDAARVHELVDQLLDREDGIIVLVDGQRAINYARGFALSACQLELLADDIERAVRVVTRAYLSDNTVAEEPCERNHVSPDYGNPISRRRRNVRRFADPTGRARR